MKILHTRLFFVFILLATYCQDSSAQWSFLGLGDKRIETLRLYRDTLYAAASDGIYRKAIATADTLWTPVGLQSERTKTFLILNDSTFIAANIITGMNGDTTSLFKSTDRGTHWYPFQNGFGGGGPYNQVEALEGGSNELFAAGGGMAVAKSTNAGMSWQVVYGAWKTMTMGTHFVTIDTVRSNIVWAGGESGVFQPFLWRSATFGETWQQCPVADGSDNACYSMALDVSDSNIAYVGMEGLVRKTIDAGSTWFTVLTPGEHPYFYGLAMSRDSILYAAGAINTPPPQRMSFYKSSDAGASWDTVVENNVAIAGILCLLTQSDKGSTTLFFGTIANGVFSYTDLAAGLHESTGKSKPYLFSLRQNYPNPFNPTTTISFQIQSKSYVSLKVFDVLGKEVTTLVAEELQPGSYTRQWNAGDLPSGVYFCRFQSGLFTQTKKLLFIK
jgi:photosystem II stability/assembly factor-like uncharacterized protein